MKAYSIPGFSNEKDLDIIYEWAKTVPENGVIVELGSMFGRTAVAFAEGAHPSVKIYCIDFFDLDWTNNLKESSSLPVGFWEMGKSYNRGTEFKKFTSDYKNIVPLTLNETEKIYPYNSEPIDILFIDASHTNPNDIENMMYFKNFLKQNSLMCGHDYFIDRRYPDVTKNVHFFERMYKTTATFYVGSSMWSIRIKE